MNYLFEDIDAFRVTIRLEGAIVGVDFGQKKIGLSISSPSRTIALPLAVLENTHNKSLFDKINSIIAKKNVVAFALGLPVHIDGKETESSKKARNFAIKLYEFCKLPIFLQEERRTTRAADSLLQIAGFSRKDRNQIDDSVAATLILESTLGKL